MKNNRLFILATLLGLFFVACEDDDDQPVLPGVGVSITKDTFGEGAGTISVSFTTTETFVSDVVLTYNVSGTATEGEDYETLPGNFVLPAGENRATQSLVIIDDIEVEQTEEIVVTLTAVDGESDFIASNNAVTIAITDNDSFPFENGILVLHEGNFFGGNASVSFVNEDLTKVTNGIFNEVNDETLGDTAQSMAFNGDLAYIVVNNSQTIEVVNRYTFESVGTVESGLLSPRYIAFAEGKGYVTNWGDGSNPDDDYVAVINLETNVVESTISVPDGPEWIVADGNTLYVCHLGRERPNNIVSVIDAITNTTTNPITVGDRPNSMYLIDGSLWVLSGGNPSWIPSQFPDLQETPGQLDRINTTTNTVEATFEFTQTEHPDFLSADGNSLYYLLDSNVFKMDVSDTSLPTSAEIIGISFYDMTVNEGRLYGVDAKDFTSEGSLEVYDLSANSLIQSLEVSIIPGAVYFNKSFEF